jgi:hypothetical protein
MFLLVTQGALAAGQTIAPLASPAERILRFRVDLRLDSTQTGRLRELARGQGDELARATSTFLRAEADLMDASRSNDLGTRRSAMEKRSKAAIEGEMTRLRAERDARALLTAKQVRSLDILLAETANDPGVRTRPIWASQVAPLPLAALAFVTADSGNVRIAVDPLTTEIFVGNRSAGFGRVALRLPVGNHTVKFRTAACIDTLVVRIEMGPRPVITHKMSCQK